MHPNWLPASIPFLGGAWEEYVDKIYEVFKKDFVTTSASFRSIPIRARRIPEDKKGRYGIFWHIIQNDKNYGRDDGIPDFNRCEKVPWIKPIIINSSEQEINISFERKDSQNQVVIFFREEKYLIVLSQRKDYYSLTTAYPITRSKKLKQIEAKFKKLGALS